MVCLLFSKTQFSINCPSPCQIKIAPAPLSAVDVLFEKVQFLIIWLFPVNLKAPPPSLVAPGPETTPVTYPFLK